MNYLREQLEASEREIYDRLTEGLKKYEKKISTAPCSDEAIQRLWELVKRNEPELFYVDFKTLDCGFSSRTLIIQPVYLYPKAECEAMAGKLEQKMDQVLAGYGGSTEAEATEYVHDWLAENVRYDYAAAQTQNVPEAVSIVGGLVKEYAVCEGIAKTVRYLLQPLGVEALVVSGEADVPEGNTGMEGGRHSWNLNRIEGKIYHMDVTWDLKETTPLNRVLHTFCNLDDGSVIMSHDWDLVAYPKATDMVQNYYMRRGCYIRSRLAFGRYVEQCISRGEDVISVKFDATAGFPDDGGQCIVNMVLKALGKLGLEKKISYVYDCSNTMFTVALSG